ncbi:MAG: AtpZ/AtpI family protein [Syntrophomonadaceae bacterium]|nr:AtpZ/AtpI family protein [Syntrophomonadaceae bacterium]
MAEKNKHWAKSLSDAINLATTVAAAVAIGIFGGRWLDGRFDTDPWLTVIGCLFGITTGMKAMWDKLDNKSDSGDLGRGTTDDDK